MKNLHGLLFSIAHRRQKIKGDMKILQRKMPGLENERVGEQIEHGNKMVDGKLCNSAVIFIMRVIEKCV